MVINRPRRVVLDANMLVLLAYGTIDRNALGRKRRVRAYMPEDIDIVHSVIARFSQMVVTPNVVTECSDLMPDKGDKAEKTWLRLFLQASPEVSIEEYVPSRTIADRDEYLWLGIADCSLLSLIDSDTVLFTADGRLHDVAARINPLCINFNHLRNFA